MTDVQESADALVVELEAGHCEALVRFFAGLPEGDRTFIREDVADADAVRAWTSGDPARRWVALRGDEVVGYVAVRRLPGWSDHVGEIRLVVAPDRRGTGLGRRLARHAVTSGVESGLAKLVVEVVAEQGAALTLFSDLGFSGEALLEDHIRDRSGELRDLLVLAHHVDRTWSGMSTLGLADELGQPGS
jgi:ribosomal protein S18 acetylase RimI-like enzyme